MSTEETDRAAIDDTRMSFLEHLSELRLRLRNAAIVFLVAVVVSFIFVKKYFVFLTRPARDAWEAALQGQPAVFHFASPTEPFWVYTKIAIIGALLAASPFVLWELWKFIAPGLYKKERRLVMVITVATAGCFVGGAIFGYLVLCTPALTYMFSFAEKFSGFEIQPTIMMDELVGFMLAMLLGTGVAFELPIVIAVLGWIGLVSAQTLWRFDKYALILSALVGGVLTPGPDILSQLLMAGPLFVLYNLSIVIVWLIERARKKQMDALEHGGGDSTPPESQTLVPRDEKPLV
ncbi:MAG: twin-arginine translocase subunit TatC [Deltaproteobacteria bacterium]|nr:twin-arginine translocase subunit TatC [Deltaproteobacteria bacterium]